MRIMGAIYVALFAGFMGGCSLFFTIASFKDFGVMGAPLVIFTLPFLIVAVLLGKLAWRIGTDQVGTPIKKGSRSADPDALHCMRHEEVTLPPPRRLAKGPGRFRDPGLHVNVRRASRYGTSLRPTPARGRRLPRYRGPEPARRAQSAVRSPHRRMTAPP